MSAQSFVYRTFRFLQRYPAQPNRYDHYTIPLAYIKKKYRMTLNRAEPLRIGRQKTENADLRFMIWSDQKNDQSETELTPKIAAEDFSQSIADKAVEEMGYSNYWPVYLQMTEAWEKICADEIDDKEPYDDAWVSSWMEETILDLSYEEDLAVRQKKMMDYLRAHRRELCGYRRAAYDVLEDLLDELTELTGAADDTDLTIRLWNPVWIQFYTKKTDRSGVNRSDFVPWKDLLDLPKTIYEKPLWRARLSKLRRKAVPVEKRDILFLNCMRWALSRENEGGIDAMNEFLFETNELLDRCGLSMIYPPNPYDRMILLAIASSSPIDVLSDLFTAATDEEELEKRL